MISKMESAIKRYNDIMKCLGYEYNTIGTIYSEGTEYWNLRDMVAECDYILSTYYEDGHFNNYMRYSDDPEDRKMWKRETARLRRFIYKYISDVQSMICYEGHCSDFD